MASGAKCFILNRKTDWKTNSVIKNLDFKNDMLVSQSRVGENGVYISGAFDSLQHETVWHRLQLEIDIPAGTIYKLRLYASDDFDVFASMPGFKGKSRINLNSYIFDTSVDVNRKIDLFDNIGAKLYENSSDILLCDLKGRYLWVCLEIINYEKEPSKISKMKIEFPKVSFVDYLPEIYREDEQHTGFLERFVGIFQSIYVDLEDKIDITPLKYDVDYTTKDFLNWIADWLSIEDASLWGEIKLRKLIKEAVKIYKMKGTKRAVAKIVQEYIGIEPVIVEQFDVKENMYYDKQKEVVERLFGNNGYVFTVMVPSAYIKDSEGYMELLKVINSVKPVDSTCNLVVLNDQIYLDSHCYMGINSFITKNEDLVLSKQHDVNNLVITEV